MTPFDLGFIVGAIFAGLPAGVFLTLAWQWWTDRPRGYAQRLRALK